MFEGEGSKWSKRHEHTLSVHIHVGIVQEAKAYTNQTTQMANIWTQTAQTKQTAQIWGQTA